MIFGGPSLGVPRGVGSKKFWETKLRLQLNNFTQKLDLDVQWYKRKKANKVLEEREKKKEKNLINVKSGLVGMKQYFKTYNRVKYFLP